MLRKEGFKNADTFQRFLIDTDLQKAATGQVVWIDEAGLLGSRDMHRLFALARERNFRVILSGDTGQHSPVPRGDAMRLLENHAGLRPARVKTVRRQKEEGYRGAVQLITDGEIEKGFQKLDELGFIREEGDETRHASLADEYVRLIQVQESCLVVVPTHSEGQKVTAHIREKLLEVGLLGKSELKVSSLKTLSGWSDAQKSVAQSYSEGLVVQLHRDLNKKFRGGDRCTVTSVRPGEVEVLVRGETLLLPLAKSEHFSVYGPETLKVRPGERIRVTANGKTADGESIHNGDVVMVKGFTPQGDLILDDERVLPRDFCHVTHGYYSTSFGSQGDTVDNVLLAQSDESLGKAASAEQFNVSVSRGRVLLTIYTDDKNELLEAVLKSSARLSAHDLLSKKRRQQLLRGVSQRLKALKEKAPVSAPTVSDTPPVASIELPDSNLNETEVTL